MRFALFILLLALPITANGQCYQEVLAQSSNKVLTISDPTTTCEGATMRTQDSVKTMPADTSVTYGMTTTDPTDSTTIPVELAYFRVQKDNDFVYFHWKTLEERNVAAFEVWHQAKSLTREPAQGGGEYEVPVANDFEYGKKSFELVEVGTEGRKIVEEVEVEFKVRGNYDVTPIQPNPARLQGTLKIAVSETQEVKFRIFDVAGRTVKTRVIKELPRNQTRTVRINTTRLASGKYFIHIEGEHFVTSERFTVLR